MLLREIAFCAIVMAVFVIAIGAEEISPQPARDTTQADEIAPALYEGSRYVKLNEWGAGIAGSLAPSLLLPPLTFYPIGYVIMPLDGKPFQYVSDPLGAIDPFWAAYIAAPLGSAAGVYLYGRVMGEQGSLAGALMGAAIGELAWLGAYFGTRKLLPESVIASNLVYFSGPLWISAGSMGGYNLLAGRSSKNPSMELMIEPRLVPNVAGVAVSLRF